MATVETSTAIKITTLCWHHYKRALVTCTKRSTASVPMWNSCTTTNKIWRHSRKQEVTTRYPPSAVTTSTRRKPLLTRSSQPLQVYHLIMEEVMGVVKTIPVPKTIGSKIESVNNNNYNLNGHQESKTWPITRPNTILDPTTSGYDLSLPTSRAKAPALCKGVLEYSKTPNPNRISRIEHALSDSFHESQNNNTSVTTQERVPQH